MSSVEYLREFVNERLTAAAEEIFRAFIKTVVEYEEEIDRQRKLLDTVLKPEIRLNRIELPQQHVCKQQEVLAEQQLCIQERNSSLDQEDPERPQIKEEQEEPCTSEEGEQLVLKQETDAFSWTPTDRESDHSEDQTHFGISETQTEVAENPLSYISVDSFVVPEPNNDRQLLYHDAHYTGSQDHKGDKLGDPESTRDVEPQQQSQHHKFNNHTNNVCNPIMLSHCDTLSGKTSLTCDTCGKVFKFKSSFQRHLIIHTAEKPFVCQTCGKAFKLKSHLWRHQKLHSGEKPYSCKICGKDFQCSEYLKAHMRTHTGEKPYLCTICGKRFRRTSAFCTHMRIHKGVKPYSCKICEKDFRCRNQLTVHERTHTGEKPYSCQICEKDFRCSSQLRAHLRMHTGEKPYSCETCGIAFRWHSQLAVHMKTHELVGSLPLQDLQEKIL